MAEEVGFEPTERVQAAQTISSRSRYDHFDTPPYSVFDVLSEKGENYTRELVIFRKRALRFLPVTTGIFSGQPSSKAMAFRVSPVMTASIPLQMQNLLYSIISRIAISLSANGAERDSRHRLRRWRITNRGSRTGSTARREHSKAHPTGSLQEPKALR